MIEFLNTMVALLAFSVFALWRANVALNARLNVLEGRPDPIDAACTVLNAHQIREAADRCRRAGAQ